jgi:hypothetical protein
MNIRRFVKRSIELKKRLFLIFATTSIVSGIGVFVVQYWFGDFLKVDAYKDEFYIELNAQIKPIININTAGMPLEIAIWSGDEIKVECVAELPLIIEESERGGEELTISQDDGFAVSLFTKDLFRYKLKVHLPQFIEYKQINITSAGGDVSINSWQLNAGRILIETKNADVSVIRPSCLYMIYTWSGNIYMDYDFLVSSAIIETGSGNVEIRIPDYYIGTQDVDRKLRVHTKSGEFVITGKDTSLPENYPLL